MTRGAALESRAAVALGSLVTGPSDEPGMAASVIRGDQVVARAWRGLASLEHRVPVGAATRFHIVSVSKTFTAAAVLVLAARGALALDDQVCRYLPGLPAAGVTIRHLLSMTSGLRDALEIERLRGVWRSAPARTRDLLDLAYRQTAVSAPAGTQYIYTNVNFVLLEEIVARVAGMPAEDFRRTVIYEPLGLAATGARAHEGAVVPDLAEPYVRGGAGGWTRGTHLLGIAGDTLTTSLDDLTRWVQALGAGVIDGVNVRSSMSRRARLVDGTEIYYGLGLAVRRYRGLTVLCHTGSQPGYKCHVAIVPERDLGLAILSNREDTAPAALAASVMDAVLGDDFPAPHPARAAALTASAIPEGDRASVEGSYVERGGGEWLSIGFQDGVLCAETLGDPLFLYAEDGGWFCDGDDYRATMPARLRLDRGPGGLSCRLELGGQKMTLVKQAPPILSHAELAEYAGRYESEEMATCHRVRADGDALVAEYGPQVDAELTFAMEPIAPDVFLVRARAPGVSHRHVFRFERDGAGRVTAVVVTMERLKNARLSRVSGEGERARSV